MEFPHIQQMYQELEPQGVTIISIIGPPVDTTAEMLRENNAVLPTAMEAKGYEDSTSIQNRYKAGVKVWFVIDSTRKVLYAGEFQPARLRNAVALLGGANWGAKRKVTDPRGTKR